MNELPAIGAPAPRALSNVKITTLSALSRWREEDVRALHGMGPKAIGILREALARRGLSFKK